MIYSNYYYHTRKNEDTLLSILQSGIKNIFLLKYNIAFPGKDSSSPLIL